MRLYLMTRGLLVAKHDLGQDTQISTASTHKSFRVGLVSCWCILALAHVLPSSLAGVALLPVRVQCMCSAHPGGELGLGLVLVVVQQPERASLVRCLANGCVGEEL